MNGPAPAVAGSRGSTPWITERTAAASVTLRVIGPAVSCAAEIGITPERLTRPSVGLTPTALFLPDGHMIDPSVSVPIATVARCADAPTAEPLLEPQGLRSSTYGLLVCPPRALHPLVDLVERKLAHSDRLALPRITAPAARRRSTRNASRTGVESSRANEPAVLCSRSAVSTLSLRSTGMPSSAPRGPRAARWA